jgi:hypothetical protein
MRKSYPNVFKLWLLLQWVVLPALLADPGRAEDRSMNGTGNHLGVPSTGSTDTRIIRALYATQYPGDGSGSTIIEEPIRANPRDISNTISAQSSSVLNNRNLSDYVWAWGQFLDHDMSLSTSSDGAGVNSSAPIAINDALDPFGPGSIPFTRSNFLMPFSQRTPINEVSHFIDASNVYGSNSTRATALRTVGGGGAGTGAKLLTSAGNLLPFNTAGLENENPTGLPANELFLAGDVRSNNNVLLSSLHTIFMREHNRLVDVINIQQPSLTEEQQYQLARKIVGAELQIVTYNEFLPALMGSTAPAASSYVYNSNLDTNDPSVTSSFSSMAFRFGHSAVSPELQLVNDTGTPAGDITLGAAFSNPDFLGSDATNVERLLIGAATQVMQEIDVLAVDDVRNLGFGPPLTGSGGLDLFSLDIQRARDHGLPHYRSLQTSYPPLVVANSFNDITTDATLALALSTIYGGNIHNVDPLVGGLAEDHLAGSSLGALLDNIIDFQFRRLRDGDRLFYLSDDLDLYTSGVLNASIASIVDLDNWTLADILKENTTISNLQANVFFADPSLIVSGPGDFDGDGDGDGDVDGNDFLLWQRGGSPNPLSPSDLALWQSNYGNGVLLSAAASSAVPEPSTVVLAVMGMGGLLVGASGRRISL